MSFDVAKHRHSPLKIYGTADSLIIPDPYFFGGQIEQVMMGGECAPVATQAPYTDGNYRNIGIADMAHAIREDRAHRASGALAFHVLEIMEAFGRSSNSGWFVEIESRPERPALLRPGAL